MSSMDYFKKIDAAQYWRFFVDGRLQKKCKGWSGYDAKEPGSVQAMINGFAFMVERFDLSSGLNSHYLAELHKICMFNVTTANLKSTPGELRYLSSGMPIFSKSTTLENIEEILDSRLHDDTVVFNSKEFAKKSENLNALEIFNNLQETKRLNYRPWYPQLDQRMTDFLQKKSTLSDFYEAKSYVQKLFAEKLEKIVVTYNLSIQGADTENKQIKVIGKIVRDLELLHPFPDGNCRTFACVLLNHLLLWHDLYPVILENPNLDGEVSYSQFEAEIVKGMENTRRLLNDKNCSLFNYSISETPHEENQTFLQMSEDLIQKLTVFSDENIYLTPQILQRILSGRWLNLNAEIRFTGVGSHNTVKKGFLYYCFLDDWKKQNKNVVEELGKIISRGAQAIVIDDDSYVDKFETPMLIVDNVDQAMKKVAMTTRQEVGCQAVLITGTVGKTSFKFQLHHCLKNQINVHAFLNSINTKIPTLRSLSSLKASDDLEVIEISVGTRSTVVAERSAWVAPDICVFTDIGPNHMDIHRTVENLVAAKATVVTGLKQNGFCIINSDAQYYPELILEIKKQNKNAQLLTYGSNDKADAYIIEALIDKHNYGWNISAVIDGEKIDYSIPLFHKHAPVQSLGVLLVAKKLGHDLRQAAKDYKDEIDAFESMGRLFKLRYDQKNILFYDQSYRGSIQGMRSAFDDIKNFQITGRKIFVIGGSSTEKDNDYTEAQHTEIAQLINNSGAHKLFTTGPYINYIHDNLVDKSILVKHSDDLDELATGLKIELEDNDFLFIMGSGNLYLGRLGKKILKFGPYDRLR